MHTAAPGTVPGLSSPNIRSSPGFETASYTRALGSRETTHCCTGQHLAASISVLLGLAAIACMSVDCLYKGSSSSVLGGLELVSFTPIELSSPGLITPLSDSLPETPLLDEAMPGGSSKSKPKPAEVASETKKQYIPLIKKQYAAQFRTYSYIYCSPLRQINLGRDRPLDISPPRFCKS